MSFNHGDNNENQYISSHSFQNTFQNNPYGLFLFALKAPETKRQYPKILQYIFNYFVKIGELKNLEIEKQCIEFKTKTIENPQWALESLLKFMVFQKERIEKKEIVSITVKNYLKVMKLFIEMNFDAFPISWKKLTRGLPPIREAANDRAPTVEELRKLIEYPDRRIKSIILSMASGGFRLGAWDYLKWKHVIPLKDENELVVRLKQKDFESKFIDHYLQMYMKYKEITDKS